MRHGRALIIIVEAVVIATISILIVLATYYLGRDILAS